MNLGYIIFICDFDFSRFKKKSVSQNQVKRVQNIFIEKKMSIFNAMEGLRFLFARESHMFCAILFVFPGPQLCGEVKEFSQESVFIILYFHIQDTDFKEHSINARFPRHILNATNKFYIGGEKKGSQIKIT